MTRQIGILFLTVIMLLKLILPAIAGKARCPDFSVSLQGSTTNMGVVYTERLTLSKVSGGSGYNGKWLVEEFEQQIDYPWELKPMVPPTSGRIDMGLGMWMNNFSRQQGPRTLMMTSTAGNYQLDVLGGKVGLMATNRFSGTADKEAAVKKYSWQLGLYALAFWKLYGEIPKKTLLYFTAFDEAVELAWTGPQLEELGANLDEIGRAHV